jgi:hypothetical protein
MERRKGNPPPPNRWTSRREQLVGVLWIDPGSGGQTTDGGHHDIILMLFTLLPMTMLATLVFNPTQVQKEVPAWEKAGLR